VAAEAEETEMKTFEQWLQANGHDVTKLTDDEKTRLKAQFDEEQKKAGEPAKTDAGAEPKPKPQVQPATVQASGEPTVDPVADYRKTVAAEARRVAAVHKLCAGAHADIEAKAIEEGWTETQTELAVLKASRPAAPAIHAPAGVEAFPVLEAALDLAARLPEKDVIADHGDKTVEAAHKRFRRGISLQELFMEAANALGHSFRTMRGNEEDVLRAAFSTRTLSGILGNTANKYLLAGFSAIEQAWREIAARRSVKDFKQITSYRMTGSFEYEEVGADGELTHDAVNEESFTNQAKTYGRMFTVTRQDIINDDLGALTDTPRKIGRGAGLKLNDVFWTAFMNNSAFFTGSSKYISGADTALGIVALTEAVGVFFAKTDADSKPLALTPKVLLVPGGLSVLARQLFSDTMVNELTTANKPKPSNNPHAGQFQPVASAYLANSNYTGYSTTAWYLLGDPEDIATVEVAFLNGVERPTVESADANFNVLGIQYRGYFDFGVARQDARGGVKSKGAA